MNQFDANIEQLIPADLKQRYTEFKFVGQGGMGRIVGARDTVLDKAVAIKILNTIVPSGTAVARFHQEARAVSKLNHPQIIQVFDFGFAASGEPFLVMEYARGENLDDFIAHTRTLPLRKAIAIATQICAGLEHAHANGVIHRDLKPSNIIIDQDGSIKILDFGLAKLLDQANFDWRLTRPGQAIGSPLYMSPEQLRGEEADERTDIYSLALVIYKMVAGCLPFENQNLMKILTGRLESAPLAIPENVEEPELTKALNEILRIALQPDREQRYAGMVELKAALVKMSDIIEYTSEESGVYAETKFVFRKRYLVCAVAIIAVSIFALITKRIESDAVQKSPLKAPALIERNAGEMPLGFREQREGDTAFWFSDTVTDEGLERLKGTEVTSLSLATNKNVTESGIKTISEIPTIERLILRETRVGNEAVDLINSLDLQWLSLRQGRISKAGILRLRPSQKLEVLDVNYIKDFDDAALAYIVKSFPNLRYLVISNTAVTANGIKRLKPLKLFNLSVGVLKLTDKDMDTIVALNPESLNLESNLISDKGLMKLKGLKKLSWLGIEYCKVSKKALDQLRVRFPGIEVELPFPKEEKIDELKELYRSSDSL